MSISLTNAGTTIALPADLQWTDEYAWQAVEQSVERSITGALIVQPAAKQGGRPITLAPLDERSGWITRATLEQLRAWAAVPGLALTLTLRGVARAVAFRHQDTAIEARPLVHFEDVQDTDNYLATVRFMEI
jgi:hypothetical protein